jgi:hypothetical protein
MSAITKKPFITVEGVKITFNIETGKIEFHLQIAFTGKKLQAWKEKNAAEILQAVIELGGEIIKKKPAKKTRSKTAATNSGKLSTPITNKTTQYKILPKRKPIYAKEL